MFLAISVINLSFFRAYAYEGALIVEPVPLSSYLREIVVSNPEIRESLEVYKGIKHEIESAKSDYKPRIGTELSGGKQVTDGVSTGEVKRNLTAGSASIYAKQNLFRGYGTENYVNETKARLMAAAYGVLDVANKVFIGAVEAYINVIKERELLTLAEKSVYTQAQILEQIRQKTESGFGRKSDLLNAQSRLALARANFISQQQNLKQASVKVHKSLGRFLDPRQLSIPEPIYQYGDNIEEIVSLAFSNYPAIEVAKYNILARKYSMKRTEALYLPTIDAELRAGYDNNTGGDVGDTKTYSAMVYLNYDLYDGGKRSADKKKNYSQILKENERSYIERRNLNESVRLAWNIKIAEESKLGFLQEHVDLSEKTLEAFKDEYQLGRRTLLELLDMENEHQSALKALIESKYATLIAKYRVSNVTGTLLYEYETSLFDKVGLINKKVELDMLNKYAKLDNNRDADKVEDSKDQCDNSIYNSETDSYGCQDSEDISIGYIKPQELKPYIQPKQEESLDALGAAETLNAEPANGDTLIAEAATLEALPAEQTQDSLGTPEPSDALAIDKNAKEQSFNFDNIVFKLNSSRLTRSSAKLVGKIAKQLKTLGDFSLEIIGHTDTSGRAAFNKKLSAQRAQSVLNKLVELGIDPAKMRAYGKGEAEPLYSNATRSGRKKNRRIEFKLNQKTQKE